MRKWIFAVLLALLWASAARAQTFTTVTATDIQNSAGQKLSSGSLCFEASTATNATSDTPATEVSYRAGGAGQVIRGPVCAAITNGAIGTFTVANSADTSPAGVEYHVYVLQGSRRLLDYYEVYVTGSTWSFDNYTPSGTPYTPPSGGGTIGGSINVAGNVSATGTVTGSNIPSVIPGEPAASDGVQYVTTAGSDSNDGLTWGTAKNTLYAAVQAIEAAGGGTVFVAAGTACGGPVSGQGLWLYRNTTSPGSGWLAATYALNIIGVGTSTAPTNGPAPVVALNCGSSTQHALDLDAINTTLRFENLEFNGSIGANIANSSTVTFENDWFQANNSSASNGPAVMIGAASFWLYFRHCVFTSNNNAGTPKTGTDASEAFVEDPGAGSQSGLVFINQSIVNGGGDIKVSPSTANIEEGIYVNGLTTENQNDGKGAVWLTNASAYSTNTVANVTVSDATVSDTPAVEVDEGVSSSTTVWNDAGYLLNYTGPMTVLSGYQHNVPSENPNESGQNGFIGGAVFGQVDAARRTFAPTASPWTNQVAQTPTSWSVQADGTLTKNTAVAAPDGTTNAISVSETGGSYTPSVYFTQKNITYAVGDYVIVGAWYRSADGSLQGGAPLDVQLTSGCATTPLYDISGVQVLGTYTHAGEWEWAAGAMKVTTGGTCGTNFSGQFNSTSGVTMSYFAPVLFHIPTGDITDAEAAQLAANLTPFPDSLSAGVEATLRGHPFAFGGSGDNYFAILDHSGFSSNQTFTLPTSGGMLCTTSSCGSAAIDYGRLTSGVCSTTTSAYATCTSTVTLNSAEPDTNYSVACTGVGQTGAPHIAGVSKSTTSVTVTISNGTSNGAVASTFSEIDCVAAGT